MEQQTLSEESNPRAVEAIFSNKEFRGKAVLENPDWSLLEHQLIQPYSDQDTKVESSGSGGDINSAKSSWPKPYENSLFMWIDSDLNASTKSMDESSRKILIHYRVWRNQQQVENRVMFLLHGFGGNTFSWRNNAQELCEKFDLVVAIDLPGFGYSSREIGLKHTRWNRAFWVMQVMRGIVMEFEKKNGEMETSIKGGEETGNVSCSIMSHSMSCSYSPELVWLVNQKDENWKDFSLKYLSKTDSNRFFRIDHLVFVAGMYFLQTLPNILNYSFVQSISKGMLKLFIGKKSNKWMLKKAYNRNPSEEEFLGYLLPTEFKNSIDSLMDMTISMKVENDNRELSDLHDQLLDQLLDQCNVIQVMCSKDTIHSPKDATRLKEMLSRERESPNRYKYTFKEFPESSHGVMEIDCNEFNNFLIEHWS